MRGRKEIIIVGVSKEHQEPPDFDMLLKKTKQVWKSQINQMPVSGFNSGRHDLELIKMYHKKSLGQFRDVGVAKKEKNHIILPTESFKFIDVVKYEFRRMM